MPKYKSKLIARPQIARLCEKLRGQGQKIVFTNGVFDILHMGHISYLAKAAEMGDILIIGLNTDASVKKIKGPDRPINKQADRAGVLSALEMVDYIVTFGEQTPEKLIKQVKPDVLVKGADYKISEIVGAEFVKDSGGQVKRIKLMQGRSTTGLIDRARKS